MSKLTDREAKVLGEIEEYIRSNGCRPRAVKDQKNDQDRCDNSLYYFIRRHEGKPEFVRALSQIGFYDVPTYRDKHGGEAWKKHHAELSGYVREHGCLPPQDETYRELAHWCIKQRSLAGQGKLEAWKVSLLQEISFLSLPAHRIKQRDGEWFASADAYEAFILEKNRVPVRVNFPSSEDERREDSLYNWHESFLANGRITDERLARFEEIEALRSGMISPLGGSSVADRTLFEAFSSLFPDGNVQYRTVITDASQMSYEVDILLPEVHFGIEFGAYRFHADKFREDKAKIAACAAAGIHLVTVIEGVPKDDVGYMAQFEGIPDVLILEERASCDAGVMAALINDLLGRCPGGADMAVTACDCRNFEKLARDYIKANRVWYEHADEVRRYALESERGCRPPNGLRSNVDGIDIGRWSTRTMHAYKKDQLSSRQMEYLDRFGFSSLPSFREWKERMAWAEGFRKTCSLMTRGHIPRNYTNPVTEEERASTWAYEWVCRARYRYAKGKLTDEQIELLESAGLLTLPTYSEWLRASGAA